jgi:threonine dehydrogenase-like Zn-dependent dehydrogenase
MRAVVLHGGEVRFEPGYPEPEPRPGETRVRVTRAGICETDLQLVRGYMGFAGVLGHEFVGIAESGPLAGARVVGEINCACGACDACLAGLRNHCPGRTALGILGRDGAFADRPSLPYGNLHRVPDGVTDDEAVFVEPLAAANGSSSRCRSVPACGPPCSETAVSGTCAPRFSRRRGPG